MRIPGDLRRRFARLPVRHPWLALAAIAVAVGVLVGAAWPLLRLNQVTLAGLGPDHPEARAYLNARRQFASRDELLVTIEARRDGQEFQLKALAEVLAAAMRDPRFISSVAWRADQLSITWPYRRDFLEMAPGQEASDGLLVNYLTDEDWRRIENRLKPAELRSAMGRLRARLAGLGASRVASRDPLGIFAPVRERLQESLIPARVVTRDGYFFSQNLRVLALFATPVAGADDIAFCRELIAFLRETVAEASAESDLFRDVEISFVGPHAAAAAEFQTIWQDALRAFGIAFPLTVALILFAYRRGFLFVTLLFPVALALVVSGALGALGAGGITPWMLAALPTGVALALHAVVHLHDLFIIEAPKLPDDLTEALRRALRAAAGPCVQAGCAVALAGGILALAPQPELHHFGLAVAMAGLTAPTVALAAAAAFTRLLVVPSRRRSISLHFRTFGMRQVAWGAMAFPRSWMALVIMATAYLGFHATRLALPPVGSEPWVPTTYANERDHVGKRFDVAASQIDFILADPDLERVLEQAAQLYERLRQARQEKYRGGLAAIVSPRNLLPSLASQEASRRRMLALNPITLERRLAEAVAEADLNFEPIFGGFLQALKAMSAWAADRPYVRWGEIQDAPTKTAIRQSLVFDGREYKTLTRVYALRGEWTYRVPEPLATALHEEFPNLKIVSQASLAASNTLALRRGLVTATLPLFLLLLLFFAAMQRSLLLGTLGTGAVLLPVWWTFGLIALARLPANFATVLTFFPMVALAVAGVAQFQARWQGNPTANAGGEGLGDRLFDAVGSIGRPLALVHLVIFVGGCSLMLADHPHVWSVGVVMSLFVVCSSFSLLAVLPCCILLFRGSRAEGAGLVGFDDPRHLYRLRTGMAVGRE